MMGSAQTDKGKVMTMAGKLAGSRPLVIVVDDDLAVRSSLQFSLEMEGFAVHTYADGRELLDGTVGCEHHRAERTREGAAYRVTRFISFVSHRREPSRLRVATQSGQRLTFCPRRGTNCDAQK